MNHAPLRILTGAAVLVLSVSLLTGAAVPVRSLPAASGEETVLARPSLQDPDTLARAVACQSLSYYRPELLDRYLAYGALWPELSPEDVVTRVNIGLDGTFYGDVSQAEEPESLSVLVNKYHPLPDGYVPRLHSLPRPVRPLRGLPGPCRSRGLHADGRRGPGGRHHPLQRLRLPLLLLSGLPVPPVHRSGRRGGRHLLRPAGLL